MNIQENLDFQNYNYAKKQIEIIKKNYPRVAIMPEKTKKSFSVFIDYVIYYDFLQFNKMTKNIKEK